MGKKKNIPIEEIDIDEPRYDLDTYWGRCKYFYEVTNPLNLLSTTAQLERAKKIVQTQRQKGKQDPCLEAKDLYNAKILFDSAFHPETGEKQILLGRMSAQVPANTVIAALLNFFYKSVFSVVMGQWLNQSFNALVNYTNRSGDSEISTKQILKCYVSATASALIVALSFRRVAQKAPPLVARFVPYIGCVGAHFVNVPMMRATELKEGTTVYDENGKKVGKSVTAAKSAISQVVFTRIAMSALPMLGVPVVMDYFVKQGLVFKNPFLVELGLGWIGFAISTPTCCALFKQYQKISFRRLEKEAKNEVQNNTKTPEKPHACFVFFNKGL